MTGQLRAATFFMKLHLRRRGRSPVHDPETVETEVAYLVLKCEQWPAFHTAIHLCSWQVAHSRATTAVVAHVHNAR